MASKSTLANSLAIQTVGRRLEWKANLLASNPSSSTDGTPLNGSPLAIVRLVFTDVTGPPSAQVDLWLYYDDATLFDAQTGKWSKVTTTPFSIGTGGLTERVFCAGADRIALVEVAGSTTNGTLGGEVGRSLVE